MPLVLNPPKRTEYTQAHFSENDVRLIEGMPRSGKTNTAVAMVRDAYDLDCAKIFCEDVLHIKCVVKSYDRDTRILKIIYHDKPKFIRVPKSYEMYSPMRIFSNLHLFGIPYTYVPSFPVLLDWINRDIVRNGWVIVDEAQVGMAAQDASSRLGKALTKKYGQFAKLKLHVLVITQDATILKYLLKKMITEWRSTEYNKNTKKVTVTIKKKGIQGEKVVSYNAWRYWRNYDTGEQIKN